MQRESLARTNAKGKPTGCYLQLSADGTLFKVGCVASFMESMFLSKKDLLAKS